MNISNSTPSTCALETGVIREGFCATEIPIDVLKPRSVRSIGPSEMLVLERGTESVVYLFDSDGDGMPDTKRYVARAPSLNHGLVWNRINDGYLYASSDSLVYRWPCTMDDLELLSELGNSNNANESESSPPPTSTSSPSPSSVLLPLWEEDDAEILVDNINADGRGGAPQGHRTRTLEFDPAGTTLYITVGSDGNVDPDSHRSRIRRLSINSNSSNNSSGIPQQDDFLAPVDFQSLDVFADGLRNTVGLAFDRHGVLWGVENGADNLQRDDLGGDITEDNAEELNRFREEDAGKHYGYPYCWTEFSLPEGEGKGTVWTWPDFLEQNYTDDKCRADYIAPIVSMQAHSAPLGMTFYQWNSEVPLECIDVASFPQWMDGYAFVAYHGSWNREVPTGYKVVYIAMDENGDAIGPPMDLLAHHPPNAQWEDGFRPVDVDFDTCGRLIVTSDGTGSAGSKIVRIDWLGPLCALTCSPSTESPTDNTATPMTELPSLTAASSSPSQAPNALMEGSAEMPSSIVSREPSKAPSCCSQQPPSDPTSSIRSSNSMWTMIRVLLLAILIAGF